MFPVKERYEILDGKSVLNRKRTLEHHYVAPYLRTFLDVFAAKCDLGFVSSGSIEVNLSDTNVTRPDVVFVSKEREHILAEGGVRGAPDLIVEIFAPSVEQPVRSTRRTIYAKHGVREYWQVDMDAVGVTVWLLDKGDYELAGRYGAGQTLISPTLKGLRIGVGDTQTSWSAKIVSPQGPVRFTYNDYLRTPADARYDLLDGALISWG